MTVDPCQFWLGKLANLNVAPDLTGQARGKPHKPLMPLTVIDLIESGDIQNGWVKSDVRLVSRFRDYWELVQDRQRSSTDIPMPFNALGGASGPDPAFRQFASIGDEIAYATRCIKAWHERGNFLGDIAVICMKPDHAATTGHDPGQGTADDHGFGEE